MHFNSRRNKRAILVLSIILAPIFSTAAQHSVSRGQPTDAVTILDSTKEQDGLVGSVRRVKTESAKLEVRSGQVKEGPLQLLEITTYGLNGNRLENVSYPIASAPAAKEEYRYDGKGNIIEMTLRSDDGAILSREVYDYEFDRFGNWKKMVTSLVVFEAGELKREPVEVTYRTLTYYFDDAVAGMIHPASQQTMPAIPAPRSKSLIDDIPPIALTKTGGLPQTGPSVSFLSESPPDAPPPVENQVPPTVVAEKDTSALSVKTRGPSLSSSAARVPSVETAKVIAPARSLNEANAVKSASALYRAGRVSFDSGDLKEAVTAYLQSLELEPNSAEVNLSLGHAYLKLKKSKEAAKAFKQAIILNPDLSEAHYGLGLHYYGLKLYQEAARAFKQATALSPDMAKAHFGLALSYQEMRDHNGLMSEYRILQRLDRALAKKLADSFPVFNLLPCRAAPFCK